MKKNVALHTRAWIEMEQGYEINPELKVALHTRAWIEIDVKEACYLFMIVALHTRAWIEMKPRIFILGGKYGRSPYESVD